MPPNCGKLGIRMYFKSYCSKKATPYLHYAAGDREVPASVVASIFFSPSVQSFLIFSIQNSIQDNVIHVQFIRSALQTAEFLTFH